MRGVREPSRVYQSVTRVNPCHDGEEGEFFCRFSDQASCEAGARRSPVCIIATVDWVGCAIVFLVTIS